MARGQRPTETPSVEARFAEDATPVPAPSVVPGSEGDLERGVLDTARALGEQPTVRIKLFQPEGTDQKLPDEFVQINGHAYLLQRGVWIDVPQGVAEVLEQARRI